MSKIEVWKNGKPTFAYTKYGMRMGPAEVEWIAADSDLGVWVQIKSVTTPKKTVTIRVTPKGTKVEVVDD